MFLLQSNDELLRQAKQTIDQCRPRGEAIALLKKAVELGSGEACGLLAWELLNAHHPLLYKRDDLSASDLAQRGTELGDMTATAALAMCYSRADGVARNALRAFELAMQSARHNNSWGFYVLGWYAYWNIYTGRDFDRAFRMYHRSAQMGNTRALTQLGEHYRYRNDAWALQCYEQAAQQGDLWAMDLLADCYLYGECGVVKNEEYARALRQNLQRMES